MILPASQVHDASELTWAPAASVLVEPHMLINPQHPHPCETGGVIRCGLQTQLDMGPHGIPRGSSLAGQSCNGGSLDAQLSDRPADRPCIHTRPGSTRRMVMLDEGRDLAGVFAAHPTSFMPPDPHRDPGPRRVDHLHHHTPVSSSNHPTTRAANQLVARLNIEHQSIWGANRTHQMEALQTDQQITPITTIKRHRAAAGRVRHRPRSLTTAGVELRPSSRTSTSTHNPRPTPGHPHSTLKSRVTIRIEDFYNRRRMHTSLGGRSPIEDERHQAAWTTAAETNRQQLTHRPTAPTLTPSPTSRATDREQPSATAPPQKHSTNLLLPPIDTAPL